MYSAIIVIWVFVLTHLIIKLFAVINEFREYEKRSRNEEN